MTSVLGLVEVTAAREVDAGFLRRLRTETYTFQDWTVDGTPLRELANVDEGDRHPTVLGPVGHVTYLVDGSDEALPSLDRFAGRAASDFPENRVALLVCAFDWDLACTTLSCRLELSPDRAVWRDLGWQSECEPDIQVLRPTLRLEFERAQYEAVLADARRHHSIGREPSMGRPQRGTWG